MAVTLSQALNALQTATDPDTSVVLEDGVAKKIAYSGGASYLVYTAMLTQSGTDAPVATVLENTLGGAVVWTRDDVGSYSGTLSGVFTQNKTWLPVPSCDVELANATSGNFGWIDADSVKLSFSDELQGVAYIEIRVYP